MVRTHRRSTRRAGKRGVFLDGSGYIGWALLDFALSDPVVQFDSFEVPATGNPENFGPRWSFVENSVGRLIKLFEPDLVGFESPFIPPQKTEQQLARERARGFKGRNVSISMIRFLLGVDAMIEVAAARAGCECREVATSTAKKAFTGRGNATKIEVKNEARRRGYAVKNDHESDAIAVGFAMLDDWRERMGDDAPLPADDGKDRARDSRTARTDLDDSPPPGWKVWE